MLANQIQAYIPGRSLRDVNAICLLLENFPEPLISSHIDNVADQIGTLSCEGAESPSLLCHMTIVQTQRRLHPGEKRKH